MTMMVIKQVHIQEVSVRDGFPIEPEFITTEQKIALLNALGQSGVSTEATVLPTCI